MNRHKIYSLIAGLACFLTLIILGTRITTTVATAAPAQNQAVTYNTTTLAGKVASVNGTAGLQIRFSAFIEQEADTSDLAVNPNPDVPITPTFVLSSALDGAAIAAPAVTVNQDFSGAQQYEAGGDPAVAFDSRGHVYYAGLGFDRTAAPNTVAVNKGTFDGAGKLTWGPPAFINQTTSPSTLNDKEWIAVDSNATSPFRDRVYVTWTRFIFNPRNGRYVQSPIAVAHSSDGGQTFSDPELIVGNVLYGQGSRPVVGPDGTVYVFWDGSTRLAALNSIWMVKSIDGGNSWSKPVAISQLVDIIPIANTAFRVNSFPAAAVAPNGDLYVNWSSLVNNTTGGLCSSRTNIDCHSAALYSKSTDGGGTWSTPALVFPALDTSNRTASGYPVTQPNGNLLNAPAARPVDTFFTAVAISPSGRVYMSAYAADIVSPWQTCATPASPTAVGRIDCLALGPYINNARLDYAVADLTNGITELVTTHPINSRYGFGGGFFGDYSDIAVGSDGVFHAFWTDTNNQQTVVWWYGFQFAPTKTNQQDVVTARDNF